MYRILAKRLEVRERRRQRRHPQYSKPELLATGPNQCWSWDITKLKGPVKWSYYYLYVILDIFSRYVVGWMVATQESSRLAKVLIAQSYSKQEIVAGGLTLHADRGSSMSSKALALLLADLGVTKSHSRPHVCDDNPYSESQFKTLKYRPEFPARFGTIQQARDFCRDFFDWYNRDHRHSGIGLHTPADVHYLTAITTRRDRSQTLEAAHALFPEEQTRSSSSSRGGLDSRKGELLRCKQQPNWYNRDQPFGYRPAHSRGCATTSPPSPPVAIDPKHWRPPMHSAFPRMCTTSPTRRDRSQTLEAGTLPGEISQRPVPPPLPEAVWINPPEKENF